MCPTHLEYRNLQGHLFTFQFSKTGKPWLWLNVTLHFIDSCMRLGSWAKYGKWRCHFPENKGLWACLRGLLSSWQCRGWPMWDWEVTDWLWDMRQKKGKPPKQISKQANKNTLNLVNESGSWKLFCQVPYSKYFRLYSSLRSLSQLLNSTIVAWRQPEITCTQMGMAVFQ